MHMTLLSNCCTHLDASICVKYAQRRQKQKTEQNLSSENTKHQQQNTQKRDTMMLTCVLTQQRRKPVDVGFTVGVQKGDDFSFGHGGAQQAGPDQPLPLLGPQNANLWQPHHVLLQRHLKVLWGDTNSSCNDWCQTQEHKCLCENIMYILLSWYEKSCFKTAAKQPELSHRWSKERRRLAREPGCPSGPPHPNTPS